MIQHRANNAILQRERKNVIRKPPHLLSCPYLCVHAAPSCLGPFGNLVHVVAANMQIANATTSIR